MNNFMKWFIKDDESQLQLNKSLPQLNKSQVQPNLLGHFITVLILLGLTAGCHRGLNRLADDRIDSWNIRPAKEAKERTSVKNIVPKVASATAAKARLMEQLDESIALSDRHLDVLIDLAKIQFISIWMSSLTFIVSGICIYKISKDGWEKTNNILFNIFIMTIVIGLVYQRTLKFLKINTNVKSNFEMHRHYYTVENEIRSYFRTMKICTEDGGIKTIFPSDFVHEIDKKLVTQRPLLIEFDGTEIIKMGDVNQRLNDGWSMSNSKPTKPLPNQH